MSKLCMGARSDTGALFEIKFKDMQAHTFITGQSGCGKSSVMTRLIEEIVLGEA